MQTNFPGLSSTAPIHIHRNRVGVPAMKVFPNRNQCVFVSFKGYPGRQRLCSCTSVRKAACPCMRTIDRSSHAGYRSILALASLAVFSPIVFIRCSFPENQQHIETGFHQCAGGRRQNTSLAVVWRVKDVFRPLFATLIHNPLTKLSNQLDAWPNRLNRGFAYRSSLPKSGKGGGGVFFFSRPLAKINSFGL